MRDHPIDIKSARPVGTGVKTQTPDTPGLRKLLRKQAIPMLMSLAVAMWIWQRVQHLDFAKIYTTISMIQPQQWGLALLATIGSFWAVGQYDRVLHAQLGTGIGDKSARRTGIAAIGLSQFVGFGALTGTLIRWRMLPELSLWQAARLSGAVALSFLAGWAVVAACAVLIFQPDIPWIKTLAIVAVVIAGLMAAISIYPPGPFVRLPWPSLRTMATVIGLAAFDTILAGCALFALMPPELALSAGQTISAYLFSLGAGLVGSTPGGVGPFEATLASLLPDVPLETLLASVLAFRIVYYLIPASLAALLIIRGPRRCNLNRSARLTRTSSSPFLNPDIEVQLFAAPRAEANLLRTRDFSLLTAPSGHHLGLVAPIGQSLVMISDPLELASSPEETIAALSKAARDRYRMPAFYKCGARLAVVARKKGWVVVPSAREAWLNPHEFSLDGSKRRQLRRILRKAQDAGITVIEGGRDLPLDDMDRVAQAWKDNRGKERGFSMGTYDRTYVTCQRVFLAYKSDELVGFITLHETRNEMTLDLMRQTREAPDGTIQLMIVAAIKNARDYNCPRFSLAAVPWDGKDSSPFVTALRARLLRHSGSAGLRRFKSSFAPHWETLYFSTPSVISMGTSALDITRRITAPAPRTGANPMAASRMATHPTLRFFRRNTP